MKIDEDQPPRKDGLIEARGEWGEVVVGSVLASRKRSEIWDVIDSKTPDQHAYARTPWFKIRERASGVEHAVSPKMINAKVTFLLTDPTQRQPELTPVSDADDVEAKMKMLVETLGAQEIYTRDSATGEIWCPWWPIDDLEHLRVAHDIDTTALEAIEDHDKRRAELTTVHGHAHDARWPAVGKGGFAHRHVPEEHDII